MFSWYGELGDLKVLIAFNTSKCPKPLNTFGFEDSNHLRPPRLKTSKTLKIPDLQDSQDPRPTQIQVSRPIQVLDSILSRSLIFNPSSSLLKLLQLPSLALANQANSPRMGQRPDKRPLSVGRPPNCSNEKVVATRRSLWSSGGAGRSSRNEAGLQERRPARRKEKERGGGEFTQREPGAKEKEPRRTANRTVWRHVTARPAPRSLSSWLEEHSSQLNAKNVTSPRSFLSDTLSLSLHPPNPLPSCRSRGQTIPGTCYSQVSGDLSARATAKKFVRETTRTRVNIMRASLTCVCVASVRATLWLDNAPTRITAEHRGFVKSSELAEDSLSCSTHSASSRRKLHRMRPWLHGVVKLKQKQQRTKLIATNKWRDDRG
ncbi:uncharacterized protein LOC143181425 [Calliopsis andreniformis]|uniref:uncharacterized protein LOC143181425 n=1 Tax=Calliopsis andreniformis TaxID=337506 RepID=UPI003FCE74B1